MQYSCIRGKVPSVKATPVPPEPNPRAVELLEPPAKTAEYEEIIRNLLKQMQ